MATSNGQRVGALLLALLFLLTTVGAAGFVVWELNQDDAGLVHETAQSNNTPNAQEPVADSQPAQVIENFDGPQEIEELRFDVKTEGDGAEVQSGDVVTIHYTGALASNGEIFDSSVARGEPATFPLNDLIPGWQQGIPGMKVGETRRLYIPSALGYGEAGGGESIPPNADLIFDIELFDTASGDQ